MSSRTSNLFNNRRARYRLIAGAFILLVLVLAVNQETSEPVRVSEPLEPRRVRLTTPRVFDAEALKKTIIENNLYRPASKSWQHELAQNFPDGRACCGRQIPCVSVERLVRQNRERYRFLRIR